jgi:CheY-like chemotaxis protein
VLNADQAMPTGGAIEITLRNVQVPGPGTPHGLKDGPYVQVTVKDDGSGIPEKHLSKIFDPYFTTKEKGSGLGLATSYSIIKQHDGLIEVASTVGGGTTFSFYLPATSAPAAPAVARSAETRPRRAGRVLVMDDEPVICRVASSILRRIGHRVETAATGEEAVELYRAAMEAGDPFDLVILDLTIRGGMGGAETVARLLEIDPEVVAVVSSGYSEDAGTAGYREQGFKAYLKKPYDLDDLRGVVNGLLED